MEADSHLYETVEMSSNQQTDSTYPPSTSEYPLSSTDMESSSIPAPPPPPLPTLPVTQDSHMRLLYKPGVDLRNCIQIKNCVVRLVLGDISEHPADVLVNSQGT